LTPAKAQSTPSSEGKDKLSLGNFHHYFPTFAAFASLREIFRFFWLPLCRARPFVVNFLEFVLRVVRAFPSGMFQTFKSFNTSSYSTNPFRSNGLNDLNGLNYLNRLREAFHVLFMVESLLPF